MPSVAGVSTNASAQTLPPSLVRIPTQTPPIAIQQPAGVPAGSSQPAKPPTLQADSVYTQTPRQEVTRPGKRGADPRQKRRKDQGDPLPP
ncbi:Phosphoinositide 3-kinase (PI3K) class III [Colletotrichum graminicola]|nr:Phosphoinositide 3-kinase (PI3K) class III [Colletotrichum graminicola]